MKKKFPIAVYSCNLNLILSKDIRKEVDRINKKNNYNFSYDGEAAGLMFALDINQYYVLISTDHLSYNTIIHECYHVVTAMSRNFSIIDEESLAYLMEFISTGIIKYFQSKNIEIKLG